MWEDGFNTAAAENNDCKNKDVRQVAAAIAKTNEKEKHDSVTLACFMMIMLRVGYLSNFATRFQKFHFWSNMVNLFNFEVPFLSEI